MRKNILHHTMIRVTLVVIATPAVVASLVLPQNKPTILEAIFVVFLVAAMIYTFPPLMEFGLSRDPLPVRARQLWEALIGKRR